MVLTLLLASAGLVTAILKVLQMLLVLALGVIGESARAANALAGPFVRLTVGGCNDMLRGTAVVLAARLPLFAAQALVGRPRLANSHLLVALVLRVSLPGIFALRP